MRLYPLQILNESNRNSGTRRERFRGQEPVAMTILPDRLGISASENIMAWLANSEESVVRGVGQNTNAEATE